MTLKEKAKLWIISHLKHPEKLEKIDLIWLDFLVDTLPSFVGQMVMFSLLTWLYLWLYKKYGFERIVILLLVNIIFVVNSMRKALPMPKSL